MECDRQIKLWGEASFEKDQRLGILTEKLREVAKALNEFDTDDHLLEEVVQVAAVALQRAYCWR